MEAGKFSFKFSRQTQKNLVGSSKYAYFSCYTIGKTTQSNFRTLFGHASLSYGRNAKQQTTLYVHIWLSI
jgi:hypothetical protein